MIHEAYMPVYMGSRFLARDGRDGTGRTEVVQEALADLKRSVGPPMNDEMLYGSLGRPVGTPRELPKAFWIIEEVSGGPP